MSHPPGFTPLCSQVRMDNDQINRVTDGELAKEASPVISAKDVYEDEDEGMNCEDNHDEWVLYFGKTI
nr:hypothetical protein [Tanacetum cinerariifolium]